MLYGDWEGANRMTYGEKRKTIETLMDHLEDYVLPSVGVAPAGGVEGTGILFASGMGSYPSVKELDRILGQLKATVPNHYAHLRGFYSAEWRTTTRPGKIRSAQGKMVVVDTRVRERVVPSWVVWRIVDHALDMLVALWDYGVVLELPPALNRKLREFVDGEGTHLTEAA